MPRGGGEPKPVSAPPGLRLRAEDAEDLAVISACLQDALVAVRDLAYDPAAQSFVLVANRFRWEGEGGAAQKAARYERTLCGVAFDAVVEVAYRGFHRTEEDRILSLLAIYPISAGGEPAGDGAVEPNRTTIDLDFAAGATIRLTAAAIRCRARDFGEPWPTSWQPDHLLDAPQ